MKRINKFFGLGSAALLLWGLAACTNDLSDKSLSKANGVINPIPTPDVVAWSGNQTFGNSFNGNNTNVTTRAAFDDWTGTPISGTKGSNEVLEWELVECKIDRAHEEEIVKEVLPEGQDNINNLNSDFIYFATNDIEFELYPIHAVSDHTYSKTYQTENYLGVFYYDQSGNKQEVVVWELMSRFGCWNDENLKSITNSKNSGAPDYVNVEYSRGVKIKIKKGYKFGFFWEGKDDNGNYVDKYYSSSDLNEAYREYENGSLLERTSTIHAGTFVRDGKTYMGIEDWVDFDYQDWVFSFNRVMPTVKSDNTDFGKTDDGTSIFDEDPCDHCGHYGHQGPTDDCDECIDHGHENGYPGDCKPEGKKPCENCGHYGHQGPTDDCEECIEHGHEDGYPGDCKPKGDKPSTGETTTPTGNEVEINLALNDIHTLPNGQKKYDIADLVSKLSIHVRYPHDVEVILPVPQTYYCNQDDLYILQTHDEGFYKYGGERVEYNIEQTVKDSEGNITKKYHKVTLGVEFVAPDADNLTKEHLGYIRVYTEGITKDLIDFLQKEYGDGINFEVYNYYNRGTMYTTGFYPEIPYNELQYKYLSHSLVNFDWNYESHTAENEIGKRILPDYYINAFNTVGEKPNAGDCYTWIIGDEHLNYGVEVYNANGILHGSPVIDMTNGQRSKYVNPYQGLHYNGSKLNWIYTRSDITGAAGSLDMTSLGTTWPFGALNLWQYIRFNGNNQYQCKDQVKGLE